MEQGRVVGKQMLDRFGRLWLALKVHGDEAQEKRTAVASTVYTSCSSSSVELLSLKRRQHETSALGGLFDEVVRRFHHQLHFGETRALQNRAIKMPFP